MLAQLIDSYIAEKKEAAVRDNSKFRVSDAGRCHRMRYWKRQGITASDEPDARAQRVFEVGHVFHCWIQTLLEKKGLLIEREKKVEDVHRIGHIDAIIETPEGLVLYDFKTVHSRKFHHRRNGEKDIHYMMQAYTYATMLNFGVEDIRIAYISKDDLCIEEVSVFEITENIEILTYEDWLILIEAWEKQKEPEPNPMEWECRYCIYKTRCNRSGK